MIKFKLLTVALFIVTVTLSCFLLNYGYTNEQCKAVRANFNKLKIGMNKEQIIPLIAGKRQFIHQETKDKIDSSVTKTILMIFILLKIIVFLSVIGLFN